VAEFFVKEEGKARENIEGEANTALIRKNQGPRRESRGNRSGRKGGAGSPGEGAEENHRLREGPTSFKADIKNKPVWTNSGGIGRTTNDDSTRGLTSQKIHSRTA